jgi:DNA-directed RNA polymerase specialized sigma24 family protein
MSPATLRRYRAERLLREEFEGLRSRVISSVRGRLRASGATLDESDLEACYASAWQGLYAVMLEGQQISNPAGWLALVTFRRAFEEQRVRGRAPVPREDELEQATSAGRGVQAAQEGDFAAELDDRIRVRQLLEGLRGRLNGRELQAATLCYLQGLSRADAAARMGVSEARMRKLMEGPAPGRPGVAGKVGSVVRTIREGGWCEEQGSLMRGLAYGILDPEGERYRLALIHRGGCPACRAYVKSLRGLAAALPPVLLPWGIGASAGAGAGAAGGAGVGAQAGSGLGSAVSTSGVAGAGAGGAGAGGAAGGWLLAGGSFSAKLAAGCLLALGVGAGCVELGAGPSRARAPQPARGSARPGGPDAARLAPRAGSPGGVQSPRPAAALAPGGLATRIPLDSSSARAVREFGPEQALAPGASSSLAAARGASSARSASGGSRSPAGGSGRSAGGSGSSAGASRSSGAAPGPTRGASAPASSAGGSRGVVPRAQREFEPG